MKILLLCNKSPWPPREGGPIAMHAMVTGLIKAGHTVKVLAANTNKYTIDPGTIPGDFSRLTGIEFATVDLRIKPFGALVNYLTGKSYHVARFKSKDFTNKLIHILKKEQFDIIQLEMLYTTVYLDIIRKYSNAKVILRAHNIEHLIWKRIAGNSKGFPRKHYLEHLYRTLREYELKVLGKMDGIVAITNTDATFFRQYSGNVPVISIPYGIDPELFKLPINDYSKPDLFHIGSMNWLPNEEGIRWFLNNVWKLISDEFPETSLHLAGRKMPEWLKSLKQKAVIVEGEVPDAWDFMQNYSIMVVPLFSGSGIRIKIIDAMLAGKAVITSTVGAEGIQYTDKVDLLIADSKEQFAEAIRLLINQPEIRQTLGKNARKLVEHHHNNQELMIHLTKFYLDTGNSAEKGAS